MTKRKKRDRDYSDVRNKLKEQIGFLIRSCNAFDQGCLEESARIATCIRVLVHDTKMSHSLLRQLNKKIIKFHDTAHELNPENKLSDMCLLKMRVNKNGAEYKAPLDDTPIPPKKTTFNEWWE